MKALIPLLFLTFYSFAQTDSVEQKKDAFTFNETCYHLWWIENKMGGYDGFEFRSNGELKLLNYDAFVGEKWWIEGERLFTEIRSRRRGTIFKIDYLVKEYANDLLILNPISVDQSLQENSEQSDHYKTILHADFTDKLTGHWQGEAESYIQVIPINSFRFQLVISVNNVDPVEKYEGFLDEERKRLIFYLEREGKEMTIFFDAGKEIVSIAGKTYSRVCE